MNKEEKFLLVKIINCLLKTISINMLGVIIAFIGAVILFKGQSLIQYDWIRCIIFAICYVCGANMMNKKIITEKEKALMFSNYALNYYVYKKQGKLENCTWSFEENDNELKEIRNYLDAAFESTE